MSDYIKKEDAMEPLYEKWKAAESRSDDDSAEIVKMDYITVSNVPSADVVEVVRCGRCEWWKCNPNTTEYGVCKKVSYDDFEVVMDSDDFCSYGEPKEQGHE